MKTIALFLAGGLAAAGAAGPVRFETEGVRVGADLVTGAALVMKGEGSPVLVSGRVVESLGAPVPVSLGEQLEIRLHAGIRLSRAAQEDAWILSTHGPSLVLEVSGKSLSAASPLTLRTTEKGFDLSAFGAPEARSIAAKVASPKAPAATPAPQGGPQQDPISPERARLMGLRSLNQTPVFGFGDPTILGASALKYNLASPPLASP